MTISRTKVHLSTQEQASEEQIRDHRTKGAQTHIFKSFNNPLLMVLTSLFFLSWALTHTTTIPIALIHGYALHIDLRLSHWSSYRPNPSYNLPSLLIYHLELHPKLVIKSNRTIKPTKLYVFMIFN